jgi:hypothetical protein
VPFLTPGKKSVNPFHPLVEMEYRNRSHQFLYDSNMYVKTKKQDDDDPQTDPNTTMIGCQSICLVCLNSFSCGLILLSMVSTIYCIQRKDWVLWVMKPIVHLDEQTTDLV